MGDNLCLSRARRNYRSTSDIASIRLRNNCSSYRLMDGETVIMWQIIFPKDKLAFGFGSQFDIM